MDLAEVVIGVNDRPSVNASNAFNAVMQRFTSLEHPNLPVEVEATRVVSVMQAYSGLSSVRSSRR